MTRLVPVAAAAFRTRRAFTLLEVIGVLVIAGLIAGVVAVSFGGVVKKATADEAAARVRWVDSQARTVARNSGRSVTLKFERERITREVGTESTTFALPFGYRIEADQQLDIGPEGRSETYLLEITGRGDRIWIATAGITGEEVVTRDRIEAQDVAGK